MIVYLQVLLLRKTRCKDKVKVWGCQCKRIHLGLQKTLLCLALTKPHIERPYNMCYNISHLHQTKLLPNAGISPFLESV